MSPIPDIEMLDVSEAGEQYASGKYDRPWEIFLASSFMRGEEVSETTMPAPKEDATVEIHPLFVHGQFRKRGGKPALVNDGDYRSIQPAVRLASRILESSALDDFFHALWCKRSFAFEDPANRTSEGKFGWEIDAKDLKCPNNRRQEVRQSIRSLAKVSHFCLDCDNGEKHENDVPTGPIQRTQTVTFQQWYAVKDFGDFEGWVSYTVIGEDTWSDAISAQKTWERTGDLPMLIGKQFELAITLVHEVAHAYKNARWPLGKDFEPYFGEEIVAEVGFQLEKELFGGHLTRLYTDEAYHVQAYHRRYTGFKWTASGLTGMFVLWDWPYQVQQQSYTNDDGELVCGYQARRDPSEVRALDVAWRVPLNFLKNLFCDDFWNDAHRARSAQFLRPAHDIGYCFRWSDGYIRPVERASRGDERYVPEDYVRTSAGNDAGMIVPAVNGSAATGPSDEEILAALVKNEKRPRWERPFEVGGRYHGMKPAGIQRKYGYTRKTWGREWREAKMTQKDKRLKRFKPS